jgi:diacylglycerol kinase (ATP)
MAGGDGSLMTCLVQAKEFGVDIDSLICCPLPFGTGNDFSRVCGWGGAPSSHPEIYKSLKSTIKEICLNSYIDNFDVWEIELNFH